MVQRLTHAQRQYSRQKGCLYVSVPEDNTAFNRCLGGEEACPVGRSDWHDAHHCKLVEGEGNNLGVGADVDPLGYVQVHIFVLKLLKGLVDGENCAEWLHGERHREHYRVDR